jgi:hypothetical protein
MAASDTDSGAVLSRDTSREAEARHVETWRSLSSVERARLIIGDILSDGRLKAAVAISGARPLGDYSAALDAVLAENGGVNQE